MNATASEETRRWRTAGILTCGNCRTVREVGGSVSYVDIEASMALDGFVSSLEYESQLHYYISGHGASHISLQMCTKPRIDHYDQLVHLQSMSVNILQGCTDRHSPIWPGHSPMALRKDQVVAPQWGSRLETRVGV